MKTLAPTTSLWLSEEIPLRPALDKNATADVSWAPASLVLQLLTCWRLRVDPSWSWTMDP
jgi:hypothetical protein